MHEERVFYSSSTGKQIIGDLIASKVLEALGRFVFLSHGDPAGEERLVIRNEVVRKKRRDAPSVGSDDVSALDGLLRAMSVNNLALSSLGLERLLSPVHHFLIQRVSLGSSDLKVNTQARVSDNHLVENVVGIADPGDGQTLEGRQFGGVGFANFEEGLQVGENLSGVVEMREGVDDGD